MIIVTGWRYWYRRYLGWIPLQPCLACNRWYWGGLPGCWEWRDRLPEARWWACYKEFCSKRCYDACGGGL